MSVETVLAVVASSFGVVMGAAPVLQIRRMLTERSSRDVSIAYFAIIALGSVLWGSYGVSIANLAIFIPNVVAFLAAIATILVAHRLRRQERLTTAGFGDGELAPPPDRQVDREPRSRTPALSLALSAADVERNTLAHGPETDHQG